MIHHVKKLMGFLVQKPVVPVQQPIEATIPRVPTPGPSIAFINQSTILTDAQVYHAMTKLQIQVDRDFAPLWKTDANLYFYPKSVTPPANFWVFYILDDTDQAGALGYHDLTDAGMPIAKIFAKTDQENKLSWTVTMSHELLEMLADPYIQNCVFDQDSNTTGNLYAMEVCDAVEDDSFGYMVGDVLVSDFVLPAWFEGFRSANSTKFDFKNIVHAPFALATGGYIGVFGVDSSTTSGWIQKTADTVPSKRMVVKGEYSRFNRRCNHK